MEDHGLATDLLAALDAENFASDHWEPQPLLLRRPDLAPRISRLLTAAEKQPPSPRATEPARGRLWERRRDRLRRRQHWMQWHHKRGSDDTLCHRSIEHVQARVFHRAQGP